MIDGIGKHHSGEAEFWAGWRERTEVVSLTSMQREVDSEHSIVRLGSFEWGLWS